MAGVQASVVVGLAILAGYVDDFFQMGLNFALALANGMLDGLDEVQQAAGALGEAAASGTAGALQIGSPSRWRSDWVGSSCRASATRVVGPERDRRRHARPVGAGACRGLSRRPDRRPQAHRGGVSRPGRRRTP